MQQMEEMYKYYKRIILVGNAPKCCQYIKRINKGPIKQ